MRNTLKKAVVAAFIIAAACMAATAGVHTHPAGTPVADDPYSTSCMPSAGTETASITECATECITDTVLPYTEISLPPTGTSGLPGVNITGSADTEVLTEAPAEDAEETDTEELTEHTATENAEETAAESEDAADASGTEAPSEEESKNTTTEAEATESGTAAPEYTYTKASGTMYATADLNVRSGPDAAFSVTGALEEGEAVIVTAKCNETGWYRISYGSGSSQGDALCVGYVSGNSLSADALESLETAAADAKDTQSVEATESVTETEDTEPAVTAAASRVGTVTGTASGLSAADVAGLNGPNLELYNAAAAMLREVAEGTRSITTTCITMPCTYGELGVTDWDGAKKAVMEMVDTELVGTCLQRDIPYYKYWFSGRTKAYWTFGHDGSDAIWAEFTWKWDVVEEYAAESEFEADTSVTSAVWETVMENAGEIINRYAGCTDVEKLIGYADGICALASYDKESAGDIYNVVNVFDGDSSTNVVCAGFAKAYLFLCDMGGLSNACCYYVSGTDYAHAWNIVQVGDSSCIVDLTRYVAGRDALLLFPVSGELPSYTFIIPSLLGEPDRTATYTYAEEMLQLLPEEVLSLTVK